MSMGSRALLLGYIKQTLEHIQSAAIKKTSRRNSTRASIMKMHLACLLLLGFTNFAIVTSSVLDISVGCVGSNRDVAHINGAIAQSFKPTMSGDVAKFAVWIKRNFNHDTSYTLNVYEDQPGTALLEQSLPVSMPAGSSLGEFRDFTFSHAVSLTVGTLYSWRLERTSSHSGSFVRCPDSIEGVGYRQGTITSEESNRDYSFKLYFQ